MQTISIPNPLFTENRPRILSTADSMNEGEPRFVTADVSLKGSRRAPDAINDWLDTYRT